MRINPNTGMPIVSKKRKSRVPADVMANASILSRGMLAARLGTQFNGERDLYETFGYLRSPSYEDYRNLYDRQGMASRVAEIFPIDTWNAPPVFLDGEARSDLKEEQLTPFLKEWNELAKRLKVWQVFKQVDIMSCIGRYSIILMGTEGNLASQSEGRTLSYITAFEEGSASIEEMAEDPKSSRYGQPEMYELSFVTLNNQVDKKKVHASRVIHIAQNKLGSTVFGQPLLQKVINRLFDLEKVTGGGAEAAWLAVYKGMLFTAKEGADLPLPDSKEGKYLDEQIQAYVHRMQRFAVLSGVEAKDMGVEEVDVKNIFETLISDLAGSLGIPQRILLGSERGELGSSQDMRHWNGLVESRRTNFAEPDVLSPFVEWCISHGVLPAPSSGSWKVEWKSVFTMNELELGQYAKALGEGAAAVSGGLPELVIAPDEWRAVVHLPPINQANLESSAGITKARSEFNVPPPAPNLPDGKRVIPVGEKAGSASGNNGSSSKDQ